MADAAQLESILRATPPLMRVLEAARDLALPDWLIVSGAVYQPVWNHLTDPDGRLHVEAPFGLDDLFAMRLRPNPLRATKGFAHTAANAQRRWPEAVVAA